MRSTRDPASLDAPNVPCIGKCRVNGKGSVACLALATMARGRTGCFGRIAASALEQALRGGPVRLLGRDLGARALDLGLERLDALAELGDGHGPEVLSDGD